MPGVYRPYTIVDVLGTINTQANAPTGDYIISSQGFFAETDEEFRTTDSMTTTVQASPAWDAGVWGSFSWT